MLVAAGHRVRQATGGREGLALLERGASVDLVLTDLNMPDLDGAQVVREVRARWPALRVGVLTGLPGGLDARSRTVDCVLQKPVTLVALREALGRFQG